MMKLAAVAARLYGAIFAIEVAGWLWGNAGRASNPLLFHAGATMFAASVALWFFWASRRLDPERDDELAALQRDAAISLLLEAPTDCEKWPRPHRPIWRRRCDSCWTCRVDKFLRDLGLRR